ncbi:MAG TPA: hypothetical protein VF933_10320, partial [Streptosporangiaceae bacterium]
MAEAPAQGYRGPFRARGNVQFVGGLPDNEQPLPARPPPAGVRGLRRPPPSAVAHLDHHPSGVIQHRA